MKTLSEKSAVGSVEPGRDADVGNWPSPLISIAIGMLPLLAIDEGTICLRIRLRRVDDNQSSSTFKEKVYPGPNI